MTDETVRQIIGIANYMQALRDIKTSDNRRTLCEIKLLRG